MRLEDDLELAERVAREAGATLLERFREPATGVAAKSSETDLVSDADREAEQRIVSALSAERPDDGLLAEEGSSAGSGSGRRWIVDPLDGTINFLYGHPAWCVSIALHAGDGALVGVVHDPVRDETFRAARGCGCELNGESVRVRDHDRLDTALIATGFGYDPERRAWQARRLTEVLPRVRDIRRGGSAALDLAWLAAGRLDCYFEYGLNLWDWSAGTLLVEEAGGVTAFLPGEPQGLAASGPRLIAPLVALVQG